MTELLTSAEAAERLKISEKTLRRLRQRGLIRYVATTERLIHYRPEDCEEYLAARITVEPPCAKPRQPSPKRIPAARTGLIVPFTKRNAR